MFGYVVANKPELKIREYTQYKSYYCGLCHMLRRKYGPEAGFTLTYDMTFLIMLLGSLYEPRCETKGRRCPIHPMKKQRMTENEITEYGADMNILLAWAHLRDDWRDERKISGLVGDKLFMRRAKLVENRYPRQAEVVSESLKKLSDIEREYMYQWERMSSEGEWEEKLGGLPHGGMTADIDVVAAPFGNLMGELFVWRDDSFAPILRRFGFFLGKYIYLRDAVDDIDKDRKNNCFNPFFYSTRDDEFNEWIEAVLDINLRSAIAEFEKLPLERGLPILRNILYEGIRLKKEKIKEK